MHYSSVVITGQTGLFRFAFSTYSFGKLVYAPPVLSVNFVCGHSVITLSQNLTPLPLVCICYRNSTLSKTFEFFKKTGSLIKKSVEKSKNKRV